MVGEHQDRGVLVQKLEQLPDPAVNIAIVVLDCRLIAMPRLMLGMGRIVVLPHPVVDPVHPDLDEHEKNPKAGSSSSA